MGGRIDARVKLAIERYEALGLSAYQIYKELERDDDLTQVELPNERTVQRIVAELRSSPSAELGITGVTDGEARPWGLLGSAGDEAALVLPVFAEALERSRGGKWLNTYEAETIAKVLRSTKGLRASWALEVGLKYASRSARGEDTHSLDVLLAFQPWLSDESLQRFVAFVHSSYPHWLPRQTAQGLQVEGALLTALRIYADRAGVGLADALSRWLGPVSSTTEVVVHGRQV